MGQCRCEESNKETVVVMLGRDSGGSSQPGSSAANEKRSVWGYTSKVGKYDFLRGWIPSVREREEACMTARFLTWRTRRMDFSKLRW